MAEKKATQHRRNRWPVRQPHQAAGGLLSAPRPITRWVWRPWRREMGKFLVILIVVSVAMGAVAGLGEIKQRKKVVTDKIQTGYQELRLGMAAWETVKSPTAQQNFKNAKTYFEEARQRLDNIIGPATGLVSHWPWFNRSWRAAENVLAAGVSLSQAGQKISLIISQAPPDDPGFKIDERGVMTGSIGALQPLLAQRPAFQAALEDLLAAVRSVANLRSQDIPAEYRSAWRWWDVMTAAGILQPDRLENIMAVMLDLFGAGQSREYLVVFQNDDELRATGGFIGTYLLVQFNQGTFKVLDAPGTGPYALDNLYPHTDLPPQPMQAIATWFKFQDANWFFNAPTSANRLLDYYQKARGFRPDGVVFLTPQLVERLLTITGPLTVSTPSVTVTAENFVRSTETEVELNYDKALNAPKQFLINFIPVLLKSLSTLSGPDALRATLVAFQELESGNIIINSQHENVTKSITALGWSGAIKHTTGDYLAVVDTNVGGGKTDRTVRVEINLDVVWTDGRWRHTVQIRRVHQGTVGDFLSGRDNRDFIRLYTPADSALVNISGQSVPEPGFFLTPEKGATNTEDLKKAEGKVFLDLEDGTRITKESGQNVFGAWNIIKPGQDQTITFVYDTPAVEINGEWPWQLFWQRQPGATARQWAVKITGPESTRLVSSPTLEGVKTSQNGFKIETTSQNSLEISAKFKK